MGSLYLDGVANRGPRSPLSAGFGGSRRNDARPQGLWGGRVGALQRRLPHGELRSLEAGSARGRRRGLLHLGLWVCQRGHDGRRDGHRGHEVIGDLGEKEQRQHGWWHSTARHPAPTDSPSPAAGGSARCGTGRYATMATRDPRLYLWVFWKHLAGRRDNKMSC